MPDRDRLRLFVLAVGWAVAAITTWDELAHHGGYEAQVLCKAGMAVTVLAGWSLTRPDGPFGAAGERWAWVGRAVLVDLALGIAAFFVAGASWWSLFLMLGLIGSAVWMGMVAKATRAARWWWPALAGAGFGAYLVSPAFLGGADPVLVLIAPTLAYAGWAAFPGGITEPSLVWSWHYPQITVRSVAAVAGAAIPIVLFVAFASPEVRNALFPPQGLSPEVAHLPLSAPSSCTLGRTTPTVYLLPLSPAGSDLSLPAIAAGIDAQLGWRIRVLPPLELTRSDADVGRRQVTVQNVWKSMTTRCRLGPGRARVDLIGVTTLDMWSTWYSDWDFVYSQQFTTPLPGAVISTIRMSPGITSGGTIAERLRKTIIRDVAIQYLGMPEGSDPMLAHSPVTIADLDRLPEAPQHSHAWP